VNHPLGAGSRLRGLAWLALLALAGVQAWSARFYATPDGVSYMDLSDAVLSGQWRELLNGYWSPLYPVLIGLLRGVLRPSAYWELAVVHLLNLLLFSASLLGFEYLVGALRAVGRTQWNKPGLDTAWGTVGAYAIFGVFTLMMTPLTLPTPDLLMSAASLFAFGALLRLRHDIAPRRSGVVLGLALAAGSLAKSFAIPWAGVCIVTAILALRGRSMRPALAAAGIWLLAVVPWTIGLSAKYGHPTFGDTGRLTYVWFVNRRESPSAKMMPSAAGQPATDSILRGIAITPDAPGTNPVWYDPARWYGNLRPEFVLGRQLAVIGILMAEYIASLAPLFLVMAFWLLAAGREGAATWWRRTWPIVVPSLAALVAYSLVLVTTRYVAPFYMTLVLAVMCGATWPARIPPTRMLIAIGVPLILMVATPNPGQPMAFINAAVGSLAFVWLARYRPPGVQIVAGVAGAVAVRLLQPMADLRWVSLMSVILILLYWLIGREAEQRDEQALTSSLTRRTLVTACAVIALAVAGLKYADSLRRERLVATEPNVDWTVSQRAAEAGMGAGSRIALVGSPFEAYWARVNRARIVAVVPPPRIEDFNALAMDRRQRLYDAFATAGADFIVVQQATPPEGDRSWMPIQYVGWVKKVR
jgi:hypothetical protein